MLGKKTFQAKLYYGLSLQDLVSQDDFYRKLELAVDLSWVRPMVAHHYSDIGRPSIDPEVFAKIELIGYIEGIIHERELMRQIHDRLSLRRYIGYDLDEQVPDHSTLSKTRDLLGISLCQEILDRSVRLCEAAGMVGGVHICADRSLVKANASGVYP
jgi:transposase